MRAGRGRAAIVGIRKICEGCTGYVNVVYYKQSEDKCDFVLDSDNPLLGGIIFKENGAPRIHKARLDEAIRKYERQEDALYYFYKALKLSASSLNITLNFDVPTAKKYLDEEYVVMAALTVAELYGINGNNVLHSVTLRKKQGKVEVIDPYEMLGREEEENWTRWRENSYQYNWSKKLPYFIAAKRK